MPPKSRVKTVKSPKEKSSRIASSVELSFVFKNETKGAVRFQEVDTNGNEINMADAYVGALYLRKTALKTMGFDKDYPKTLTVTVAP